MNLVGFAALFAAGVLLAGVAANVVGAQTTETTTETVHQTTTVTQPTTVRETTTVQQTTTAPGTTVLTTTTVAPTTTTPATTTSTEAASGGTPTWVWVLLAVLGAAVIGMGVLLLTRRGPAIPDSERRLRLQGAIDSWLAQGWALTSQTTDTAVLRRGDEQMILAVDPAGQLTRQVTAQPPPTSPRTPDPQGRPPDEQPTQEQPPQDRWPGG